MSSRLREDIRDAAFLITLGTAPVAGLIAVLMSTDAPSGTRGRYFETVHPLIFAHSAICSTVIGLPTAAVTLPTAWLMVGISEKLVDCLRPWLFLEKK